MTHPIGASQAPSLPVSLADTPTVNRSLWEQGLPAKGLAVSAPHVETNQALPGRSTAKPAHDCVTGMISSELILMCAGWLRIQKMVSAMSCG